MALAAESAAAALVSAGRCEAATGRCEAALPRLRVERSMFSVGIVHDRGSEVCPEE